MSIFHDILRQYWGYEDFRPMQLDIIESLASGRDTLGLMPTGGGKSITFQVPALAKEGICLVVTPLVALMKDQVERLRSMGIKAACIYSGMTQPEIVTTFDNCVYGDYKFLYVSPERLGTDLFLERLQGLDVNYLVVDEAHCISQWGYDFRPSYLQIASVRQYLPGVPVLAVTATATPDVVDDIQVRLGFEKPNVFSVSFERSNLSYVVRRTDDKDKMLLKLLAGVPGTAIVYVRMRKRTQEVAAFLQQNGISADYYHAGLSDETKNLRQADWKSGKTRVIASTNAFGMGIDKADVRLVVHYDMPDSIEAYFQEAGRAGRDGKKAYAVLLFQAADATRLKRRIADTFPDKDYIRKVYDKLCYHYEIGVGTGEGMIVAFDLTQFCVERHLNPNQAFSALKILQQAGYLELTDEEENNSRVCFNMDRNALYEVNADADTERVLQVLLRSYSGLFADYVRIDESLIAQRCQTDRESVYKALKKLQSYGVLTYIPQRKTPYVILTKDRVEGKELRLTADIYEDRQRRFEERIGAMVSYATDDSICRSRRLLHYFGQKHAPLCHQCDVCLKRTEQGIRQYEADEIMESLALRLKDGSRSLEELADSLSFEPVKVLPVLRFMMDRGLVDVDNFDYSLSEKGRRRFAEEGKTTE